MQRLLTRRSPAVCAFAACAMIAFSVSAVVRAHRESLVGKLQRIQPGMTVEEVVAILGPQMRKFGYVGGAFRDEGRYWTDGDQLFIVYFDDPVSPRKCVGKYHFPTDKNNTWIAKLWERLKRLF